MLYAIEPILNSPVSKIKFAIEKTANSAVGLYKFFNGMIISPNQNQQLKIEDTELEVAQKIYDYIKIKQEKFHNPNRDLIYKKYSQRILEKDSEYKEIFTNLNIKIENLKSRNPSWIKRQITAIFLQPPYDEETRKLLQNTTNQLYECEKLYEDIKFNSAILCLKQTENIASLSESKLNKDLKIVRKYDWVKIMMTIILTIIVTFLTIKIVLGFKDKM